MLKNLPIMLLSSAQKSNLLCSKLCFKDYPQELITLLSTLVFPDCSVRVISLLECHEPQYWLIVE